MMAFQNLCFLAISYILKLSQGTLSAKNDIKHAFRLLPVHPADRHLLPICWRHQIIMDTCLSFGLRSAPKLFNILAAFFFLSRILTEVRIQFNFSTGRHAFICLVSNVIPKIVRESVGPLDLLNC